MIHDKACCKPSVLCEPSLWHVSLPGKQSHVCNIMYDQLQENLIALPVTRLTSTGVPFWSRLWLTEKIRARGTFNSLSFAEMGYGLSQQLPRGVWVPGPHSDCCTLAWEEVSDVWDTKAALWYVPNMVSCWVFVSWLCLFPYLPPPWGIPLCGIFLCQHSSADNIHVLLNNQ